MTKSFDLQSLIWLIHSEIASAVNAVKSESNKLMLQEVRVRMGQDSEQKDQSDEGVISLSIDRYPAAQQGWMIDVVYDASKVLSKIDNAEKADVIPKDWQGVSSKISVRHLEGVGVKYEAKLQKLGINSLRALAEFDVDSQKGTNKSIIRRLQTLTDLALQLPPIALTSKILQYNVIYLIEHNEVLSTFDLSKQGEVAIHQWLLTLEICFNNDWLRRTLLHEMISPESTII